MPNNPVQVILNTRDYFVAPEAGRFGPSKDFFEGRDQEFVVHRDKLIRQVASISTAFQRSGATAGVLKVSLRRGLGRRVTDLNERSFRQKSDRV